MSAFELPHDLKFNRGMIADPGAYVREAGCASWLFLVGDEFASMPGGLSWEQVRSAVPHSARVVSDPPRELDLALARRHVEALDDLPRPTLISCRAGPRASAVAYMYAGLKEGADPDRIVEAAERDAAPFCASEGYKDWVRTSMVTLRDERGSGATP